MGSQASREDCRRETESETKGRNWRRVERNRRKTRLSVERKALAAATTSSSSSALEEEQEDGEFCDLGWRFIYHHHYSPAGTNNCACFSWPKEDWTIFLRRQIGRRSKQELQVSLSQGRHLQSIANCGRLACAISPFSLQYVSSIPFLTSQCCCCGRE